MSPRPATRSAHRRLVAALVVGATLGSACGTSDGDVAAPSIVTAPPGDTSTTTTETPGATSTTGSRPPRTSAPPPAVEVEEIDCPPTLVADDLACALVTVPLDRDDPSSGTTTISVAALAGTEADDWTAFAVLQGGPGGASTELTAFYPRRPFTQVFIDQRGTGFGAADFDCIEVEGALFDIWSVPSEEGEQLELDAYDDCAERLANDPVLATTDTETLAADVIDVMDVLGYPRWIVYGVSYGTTIASQLTRMAPPQLEGAVLDSVYPIDLDVDAGIAESATTSLAELDRACAADDACSRLLDDVDGTLDAVMADLADQPLLVELDAGDTALRREIVVVVDDDVLAGMVFRFLYSESRLRYVPGLLDGLSRRDPATARWLALMVVETDLASVAANDEGTWFAVQCADRLPFTDGPPTGLSAFAESIAAPGLAEICEPWNRPPAAADLAEPVVSDLPTLIVGGQFDPITPPAYAERVAADLGSATVAIRGGRAHGVWFGDDCIAGIIEDFAADPGTPVDVSCAAEPESIDWRRPAG